jgi:hypothetical protein
VNAEFLDELIAASVRAVPVAPDRVERLIDGAFRRIDRQASETPARRVGFGALVGLVWPPRLGVLMAAAAMLGLVVGDLLAPASPRVSSETETVFSTSAYLPVGS